MYRQDILDHYKNPENFGQLDPHTLAHRGENPLCGDSLEVTMNLDDSTVSQARFQGQGCAIAQASTDILLAHIQGKTAEDVLTMDDDAMVELLGIEVSPMRLKCAVLGLLIVQDGLKIHRGEMEPIESSNVAAD